ncbi:hypothetical protein B0H13DRAFT_1867149 [Mycena leptocephala]|nr:hypothetical protein B0H13DRAFT_1867149 [Mycena leptocephala]
MSKFASAGLETTLPRCQRWSTGIKYCPVGHFCMREACAVSALEPGAKRDIISVEVSIEFTQNWCIFDIIQPAVIEFLFMVMLFMALRRILAGVLMDIAWSADILHLEIHLGDLGTLLHPANMRDIRLCSVCLACLADAAQNLLPPYHPNPSHLNLRSLLASRMTSRSFISNTASSYGVITLDPPAPHMLINTVLLPNGLRGQHVLNFLARDVVISGVEVPVDEDRDGGEVRRGHLREHRDDAAPEVVGAALAEAERCQSGACANRKRNICNKSISFLPHTDASRQLQVLQAAPDFL